MEVVDSASKLKTNVDTLTEELKEKKSAEAEELNFTPKSSFVGVLGILDKIKNGKDVEDTIQSNFTTISMLNNAYTYLSAENEKYSHVASFEEIKNNDYNLNIPRYVDTFEEEEILDIGQVDAEIADLKTQIAEIEADMDKYLKELGLE